MKKSLIMGYILGLFGGIGICTTVLGLVIDIKNKYLYAGAGAVILVASAYILIRYIMDDKNKTANKGLSA